MGVRRRSRRWCLTGRLRLLATASFHAQGTEMRSTQDHAARPKGGFLTVDCWETRPAVMLSCV
jgi:hypothetical protein